MTGPVDRNGKRFMVGGRVVGACDTNKHRTYTVAALRSSRITDGATERVYWHLLLRDDATGRAHPSVPIYWLAQ